MSRRCEAGRRHDLGPDDELVDVVEVHAGGLAREQVADAPRRLGPIVVHAALFGADPDVANDALERGERPGVAQPPARPLDGARPLADDDAGLSLVLGRGSHASGSRLRFQTSIAISISSPQRHPVAARAGAGSARRSGRAGPR